MPRLAFWGGWVMVAAFAAPLQSKSILGVLAWTALVAFGCHLKIPRTPPREMVAPLTEESPMILTCPQPGCHRAFEVSEDDPDSTLSDIADHLTGSRHSLTGDAVLDALTNVQPTTTQEGT